MTIRKIVYLGCALLITGFILFLYFSFNGNPISKAIAKKHALNYLEQKFPTNNYRVQDSTFNFKDDYYYFNYTLTANNERQYHYSVGVGTGFNPNRIMSNTLRYDSENIDLTKAFSDDGTIYVRKLLENNNMQGDIYYYVQVPIDYLDKGSKWSPHLMFPVNAEITVFIEQHFESEELFISYVNSIIDTLNEVNFDHLYVENRFEDQLIYTLKINKDEKAQIEKVLKNKR